MDQSRQTGPSWHVRFLIAGIIIATAFIHQACSSEKKASTASPSAVTVLTVVQKDVPVVFEYVAQTQSSHLVNIQARVSGFLDKDGGGAVLAGGGEDLDDGGADGVLRVEAAEEKSHGDSGGVAIAQLAQTAVQFPDTAAG